jgi:hypothetical protein
LPEEVAQRVDAVRDVVEKEHPHATAPQQPGERGFQRAPDRKAQPEGRCQAPQGPDHEGAVDEPHHRVRDEIGSVAIPCAAMRMDEEPPDVRVGQSTQCPRPTAAVVDVWAVGIALLV